MARRKQGPSDTLEELESLGDRLARWVAENPFPILAVVGTILAIAAIAGGYAAWSRGQAEGASMAFADARREYVEAMGGKASDFEVPEPANPETAQEVRNEFVNRFVKLGQDYAGTAPGALALLEAGEIYLQLEAPDRALEVWQQGVEQAGADSAVRAVLLSRVARLQEQDDEFEAAARSHEAAAAIAVYPLRYEALGDAARCWLEAGRPEAALAIQQRLATEAPDVKLPPYVQSRLDELGARSQAPPQAAAAETP
ncbi:MAG: tetratricopeptide repeat protein [Myxococcota bacterium]|nr:tetratricopeptide repeat protein [Myxococcota bacterium]